VRHVHQIGNELPEWRIQLGLKTAVIPLNKCWLKTIFKSHSEESFCIIIIYKAQNFKHYFIGAFGDF